MNAGRVGVVVAATALLALGCGSPVRRNAFPVYELSVQAAEPPGGTTFRPGEAVTARVTVDYYFSKAGGLISGCSYCGPSAGGCTFVPDETREHARAYLRGTVTLGTTCTVPLDAERLLIGISSIVALEGRGSTDLGPSVRVEYEVQR